jgi:hypothetical protein
MYGTTGKVTEEVKQAVESLRKNARVKVSTHISGGGGSNDIVETSATEDPDGGSQLLAIKREADEFYKELKAGKHRYRRLCVSIHFIEVKELISKLVRCYGRTPMSRISAIPLNRSTTPLRVVRLDPELSESSQRLLIVLTRAGSLRRLHSIWCFH